MRKSSDIINQKDSSKSTYLFNPKERSWLNLYMCTLRSIKYAEDRNERLMTLEFLYSEVIAQRNAFNNNAVSKAAEEIVVAEKVDLSKYFNMSARKADNAAFRVESGFPVAALVEIESKHNSDESTQNELLSGEMKQNEAKRKIGIIARELPYLSAAAPYFREEDQQFVARLKELLSNQYALNVLTTLGYQDLREELESSQTTTKAQTTSSASTTTTTTTMPMATSANNSQDTSNQQKAEYRATMPDTTDNSTPPTSATVKAPQQTTLTTNKAPYELVEEAVKHFNVMVKIKNPAEFKLYFGRVVENLGALKLNKENASIHSNPFNMLPEEIASELTKKERFTILILLQRINTIRSDKNKLEGEENNKLIIPESLLFPKPENQKLLRDITENFAFRNDSSFKGRIEALENDDFPNLHKEVTNNPTTNSNSTKIIINFASLLRDLNEAYEYLDSMKNNKEKDDKEWKNLGSKLKLYKAYLNQEGIHIGEIIQSSTISQREKDNLSTAVVDSQSSNPHEVAVQALKKDKHFKSFLLPNEASKSTISKLGKQEENAQPQLEESEETINFKAKVEELTKKYKQFNKLNDVPSDLKNVTKFQRLAELAKLYNSADLLPKGDSAIALTEFNKIGDFLEKTFTTLLTEAEKKIAEPVPNVEVKIGLKLNRLARRNIVNESDHYVGRQTKNFKLSIKEIASHLKDPYEYTTVVANNELLFKNAVYIADRLIFLTTVLQHSASTKFSSILKNSVEDKKTNEERIKTLQAEFTLACDNEILDTDTDTDTAINKKHLSLLQQYKPYKKNLFIAEDEANDKVPSVTMLLPPDPEAILRDMIDKSKRENNDLDFIVSIVYGLTYLYSIDDILPSYNIRFGKDIKDTRDVMIELTKFVLETVRNDKNYTKQYGPLPEAIYRYEAVGANTDQSNMKRNKEVFPELFIPSKYQVQNTFLQLNNIKRNLQLNKQETAKEIASDLYTLYNKLVDYYEKVDKGTLHEDQAKKSKMLIEAFFTQPATIGLLDNPLTFKNSEGKTDQKAAIKFLKDHTQNNLLAGTPPQTNSNTNQSKKQPGKSPFLQKVGSLFFRGNSIPEDVADSKNGGQKSDTKDTANSSNNNDESLDQLLTDLRNDREEFDKTPEENVAKRHELYIKIEWNYQKIKETFKTENLLETQHRTLGATYSFLNAQKGILEQTIQNSPQDPNVDESKDTDPTTETKSDDSDSTQPSEATLLLNDLEEPMELFASEKNDNVKNEYIGYIREGYTKLLELTLTEAEEERLTNIKTFLDNIEKAESDNKTVEPSEPTKKIPPPPPAAPPMTQPTDGAIIPPPPPQEVPEITDGSSSNNNTASEGYSAANTEGDHSADKKPNPSPNTTTFAGHPASTFPAPAADSSAKPQQEKTEDKHDISDEEQSDDEINMSLD